MLVLLQSWPLEVINLHTARSQKQNLWDYQVLWSRHLWSLTWGSAISIGITFCASARRRSLDILPGHCDILRSGDILFSNFIIFVLIWLLLDYRSTKFSIFRMSKKMLAPKQELLCINTNMSWKRGTYYVWCFQSNRYACTSDTTLSDGRAQNHECFGLILCDSNIEWVQSFV